MFQSNSCLVGINLLQLQLITVSEIFVRNLPEMRQKSVQKSNVRNFLQDKWKFYQVLPIQKYEREKNTQDRKKTCFSSSGVSRIIPKGM